jgi:hypothetical protein
MKETYDTERLVIRRACDKDLNDLYTIFGEPKVMGDKVKTYDETLKLMKDAYTNKNQWVVFLKDNLRVICFVQIISTGKDEYLIDEYINETYNTKGMMYEVARTFCRELFDASAKKVKGMINFVPISGEKLNDRLNYAGVVNKSDCLVREK